MPTSSEWKLDTQGRYLYFDGHIEKPDTDISDYRLIKLVENDLVALLIHNSETDTASAAMDVNAGSLHDPAELQGLAHYIEHLVFMGTEKFPKENEFDSYTSAHSGDNNACTNLCSTNYYFKVAHNALEGTLDRFSQFFISPLFTQEAITREVEAVDSEFKQHGQKDSWRVGQLQKALSNPKHPYSQFDIGSREALEKIPQELKKDVREEVLKFFNTYYSANLMKLCIMGRESLDQLSDWAVEKFKDIPNKNAELPTFVDCPPIAESQLKKQVFVKPSEDGGFLQLVFPFPDQEAVHNAKPSDYIIKLIDYEGPGSLQSYLKRKGWANYIAGSLSTIDPTHSALSIYVGTTNEGAQQYRDIMAAIFRYINLVKKEGIQEYLFKDLQSLNSLSFRFQDTASPSVITSFYSGLLKLNYPPQHVLNGTCIPTEYDPALIEEHLSYIRPDNFSFFLVSDSPPAGIEFTERERWFGAEYNVLDFDDSLIELLDNPGENVDGFAIPAANDYTPSNFDSPKREVSKQQTKPDLIENSPLLRLWHKRDDTFWTLKTNIWMTIKTPLAYASPAHSVKTLAYAELVTDALMEITYDARLAGLYYSIEGRPEGLLVFFGGYTEKLHLLVDKIVHHMRHLKIDPQQFDLVKERLTQNYKNFALQEPSDQASLYLSYATDNKIWLNPQRLEALENITYEDIQAFYPTLLSQCQVEALAHGNITQEQASEMLHRVIDTLGPDTALPSDQLPKEQSLSLSEGERWIYKRDGLDPNNVNSAIDYLIPICSTSDVPLRNRLRLVRQVVYERFFNQLRTNEQLGYNVGCYYFDETGSMGLDFCVQSERDTLFLENRIDTFVQGISEYVRDMSDEDFGEHVQSIISSRQEKRKNALEEAQAYWVEIAPGWYDFERNETDIKELQTITKDDLLAFIEEYIDLKSPKTRKLSVHIQSQKASKSDMVFAFLSGQGVSGLVLDDVKVAVGDNTYEVIEVNLRQLLSDKCQVESDEIDHLITALIAAVTGEQDVAQLSVGETTTLAFPNEFVGDIADFKKTLILNPPAEPVTDTFCL